MQNYKGNMVKSLSITCPTSVQVETSDEDGAIVQYGKANVSGGKPPYKVTYSRISGSKFPVGLNTVYVTATDRIGQIALCSFSVVVDLVSAPTPPATTPLTLVCPPDQTISIDGTTTNVTYGTATASGGKAPYNIIYDKASGSVFPLGTTTVLVTASDSAGASVNSSFNIVVQQLVTPVPPVTPPPTPSGKLVQQANLTYTGAFRYPNADGYSFGSQGLAYNAANNSLFTIGHVYEEKLAEISIPTPSMNLSALPFATEIQPLRDAWEGNRFKTGPDGVEITSTTKVGGLLIRNGRLIGNNFVYYDAGFGAVRSHWAMGLNLSTVGDFQGMYTLGTLNPGFVAGYMCDIPPEWQAALGGPCLTGAAALAINSRTSSGPSLHVFDPDHLTGPAGTVVAARPLVAYPHDHPTLGIWDNQTTPNVYFNMACEVFGVVFPKNTDSVLVFGAIGEGIPGYGAGVVDQSLDRQPIPGEPGVIYCYDPYSQSKGAHGWPYHVRIWAYDANELAQVRAGTKQYWEVIPYATWAMDASMPVHDGYGNGSDSYGAHIAGVAYDQVSGNIYVAQGDGAEHWCPNFGAFSYNSLMRVYRITGL